MYLYILLVSRQMSPRERSNLSGLPRTIIPALAAPAPHHHLELATLCTGYFHPVKLHPCSLRSVAEVSDSWRSAGSKKLMSVLTIYQRQSHGQQQHRQLGTQTLSRLKSVSCAAKIPACQQEILLLRKTIILLYLLVCLQ